MNLQLYLNTFFYFSIYLIVSNSFALIYYPTKFFHFAHAAIISLGAYFVFLFLSIFSMPLFISVILAIILASLIGIACEVFIYRFMRKSKVQPLSYLIASIGLYVVLQNCISFFFGDNTKIINTSEVTVGNHIYGAYINTIQILTIFISIFLSLSVHLFMHYSTMGKSIRAVSSNPELCNIYGISSNKIILIAFGIGSALASSAGILSAMNTNLTPTFGFNLLIYGVVVMIIGGVGSTYGLIAGSLLVATAQHLAAYYINTRWMDAVTYFILILFLIWKPLGFSGKRLKKVEV